MATIPAIEGGGSGTTTHAASSEVLPAGSVVVAVMACPNGTSNGASKTKSR